MHGSKGTVAVFILQSIPYFLIKGPMYSFPTSTVHAASEQVVTHVAKPFY